MYRLLIILLCAGISLSTYASSVDSVGVPSVGSVVDYSSDSLVIASYVAPDGQLRTRFLYALAEPSSIINIWEVGNVTGYFSIDVAQSYDLNEDEHEIRMGFSAIDQRNLVSGLFYASYGGVPIPAELSWYVSTEGLLGGTALNHHAEMYTDEPSNNSLWFEQGSPDALFVDWGPFICIECGFDMTLNLLFMDFTGGNLSLSFEETRQDIILGRDHFSGYSPYGYDLNLTTTVPVPAAWLLLVSALPFLARRKK